MNHIRKDKIRENDKRFVSMHRGWKKAACGLVFCMVTGLIFAAPVFGQVQAADGELRAVSEISEAQAASPNSGHGQETLKERKAREQVVETIMSEGVTIDESDFLHLNEKGADYFAAEHGKGSGYYDVNKKFDGIDDGFCSGVVVTNMLHWWIDRNEDYVARYLDQSADNGVIRKDGTPYKQDPDIRELRKIYSGDDRYNDQSAFFDFIKETFKGQYALSAEQLVNMYFSGYGYLTTQMRAKEIESSGSEYAPTRFNFFNKVMRGRLLTDLTAVGSIDAFSGQIRQTLKAGGTMAVIIFHNAHAAGHIVNVWGADFDAQGRAVAVYVTDSDDGSTKIGDGKKIGMKRYRVDSSGGVVKLTTWEQEGTGANAGHLYSFASGKPFWAEYFAQTDAQAPGKADQAEHNDEIKAPSESKPTEEDDTLKAEPKAPSAPKASPAYKTGWHDEDGARYYVDQSGNRVKGWQRIEGRLRYFDTKSGRLMVGLIPIRGKIYLTDSEGKFRYGWQKTSKGLRYFDMKTGAMMTGLFEIGGRTYLTEANGAFRFGWQRPSGKLRYFDTATGAMMFGRFAIGRNIYMTDSQGAFQFGWQRYNGKLNYFDTSSGALKIGFWSIGGRYYLTGADGAFRFGRQTVGGRIHYFDHATGQMIR